MKVIEGWSMLYAECGISRVVTIQAKDKEEAIALLRIIGCPVYDTQQIRRTITTKHADSVRRSGLEYVEFSSAKPVIEK